jgi:hypothetical protein
VRTRRRMTNSPTEESAQTAAKLPQTICYSKEQDMHAQTGSTRHRGHLLSYCACPEWLWGWTIIRWNEDWQGKPKYSEKTCSSATLSTTNLTWPGPRSNPGRRGGKPAHSHISTCCAISISWNVVQFRTAQNMQLRDLILLDVGSYIQKVLNGRACG